MRFLKSSCAECGHTDLCSKQTRMYVNYCGSDRARVSERIRKAQSECAGHKGHTLFVRRGVLAA